MKKQPIAYISIGLTRLEILEIDHLNDTILIHWEGRRNVSRCKLRFSLDGVYFRAGGTKFYLKDSIRIM